MHAGWRRGVYAALGAAVVLAFATGMTSAHSVLQRSIPPANASLLAPPRQIVLIFSEPVVAGLSAAAVADRNGTVVSHASTVAQDGRTLAISIGPLATGVYTVRWRVLSATDGHTTSGFLLFGVGEAAGYLRGWGMAQWSTVAVAWRDKGRLEYSYPSRRSVRPADPDVSIRPDLSRRDARLVRHCRRDVRATRWTGGAGRVSSPGR